VPIALEPTPSPRHCISATGATPQRTWSDYHALVEGSIKTGTFYFAGKRNFLLCLDRGAECHQFHVP